MGVFVAGVCVGVVLSFVHSAVVTVVIIGVGSVSSSKWEGGIACSAHSSDCADGSMLMSDGTGAGAAHRSDALSFAKKLSPFSFVVLTCTRWPSISGA